MKYLGIFILLLLSNVAFSQLSHYIISSGGNVLIANALKIEYSMGEVCVETLSNNGIQLTQGYHQPSDSILFDFLNSETEERIKIYPNPSQGILSLNNPVLSSFDSFRIYDSTGSLCGFFELQPGMQTVDLQHLCSGYYTISLTNSENKRKINQTLIIYH